MKPSSYKKSHNFKVTLFTVTGVVTLLLGKLHVCDLQLTVQCQGSRLTVANYSCSHRLVEVQFWLVGFGLSLAKMASENFRHFSGKKLQIKIDSERTELTSTLLTISKNMDILKYQKANEQIRRN